MTDPRGVVTIKAGDDTFRLEFTVNGICELESRIDCGAPAFMQRIANAADDGSIRVTDVRLVLWAGLQEHHPEMTERQVGTMIAKMGGVLEAMEAIEGAFRKAFPVPDDDGAEGVAEGNGSAAA